MIIYINGNIIKTDKMISIEPHKWSKGFYPGTPVVGSKLTFEDGTIKIFEATTGQIYKAIKDMEAHNE